MSAAIASIIISPKVFCENNKNLSCINTLFKLVLPSPKKFSKGFTHLVPDWSWGWERSPRVVVDAGAP